METLTYNNMEKNIIIITNLSDVGNKALVVKDFSDKSTKQVISFLSGVPVEDVQCESSSMSGAFYSIRKNVKKHEGIFLRSFDLPIIREDNVTIPMIRLVYATLQV